MSITVYEPLLKKLRDQIRHGAFDPGTMLGTELQFARQARISRDSVRLAVDSLVEEGLVERRAGKGVFVRKPTTALITELIVPNLDALWADVAAGAQTVARERGFKSQIFNASGDFQADLDAIRRLPLTNVDGAIIGSLHQRPLSEAVIELWQQKFPIVVVDQQLQDVDVPSVEFDNSQVGYLAGQHLLEHGHRRIGFVGYAGAGSLRGRLEGLRTALNDAGVPFQRHWLAEIEATALANTDDAAPLQNGIERLMQQPNRPTAILFHHDGLALRGLQVARKLGLRVPEQLSIVGVGNGPQCEWADPPLATIELPAVEMGRVAMELLLERIADSNRPIEHRVLPVHWVGRASVQTVPGKPPVERQATS